MNKLPARTGWDWIRQGFALFRKQPGTLSIIFLGYMVCMLGVSIVPGAGELLAVILIPVFSAAFMQACAAIDRGEFALPSLLTTGFRKPVFGPLFRLGIVYLMAAGLAVGATTLIDGGSFWQLLTGQMDPNSKAAREAPLGASLLLAGALYLPAAMGFAFAAPLILWQRMGVGKALFYSFFAVWRDMRAFVVFALAWFGLSLFITNLVLLITGSPRIAVFVITPVSVILTLVMHCSFYASYRQVFNAGQPVAP